MPISPTPRSGQGKEVNHYIYIIFVPCVMSKHTVGSVPFRGLGQLGSAVCVRTPPSGHPTFIDKCAVLGKGRRTQKAVLFHSDFT